jgi:hypothetical protein
VIEDRIAGSKPGLFKYKIQYEFFDGKSIFVKNDWCAEHVVLNLPEGATEITAEMYKQYEQDVYLYYKE